MEFQDRILRCVDCGKEFVWTAGEQQFFADKNFKNEPKRCKACKGKAGQPPGGGDGCSRASRDGHQLLELRQRNHGAVQTHPGTTGLLQGVFPVPKVCRGWGPVAPAVSPRSNYTFHLARSGRLPLNARDVCTEARSAKWCVLSSRARTHLERFHADRRTNDR